MLDRRTIPRREERASSTKEITIIPFFTFCFLHHQHQSHQNPQLVNTRWSTAEISRQRGGLRTNDSPGLASLFRA
ncbi:hypothetical protein BJX96DRAFT_85841 [Aspergillus floccosus]